MGKKKEHGAIPILKEEIESRQRYLMRRRDDMKRHVDEIKENLDKLVAEPNNLNHSARVFSYWPSLSSDISEMQGYASEILQLERAIEVLKADTAAPAAERAGEAT